MVVQSSLVEILLVAGPNGSAFSKARASSKRRIVAPDAAVGDDSGDGKFGGALLGDVQRSCSCLRVESLQTAAFAPVHSPGVHLLAALTPTFSVATAVASGAKKVGG